MNVVLSLTEEEAQRLRYALDWALTSAKNPDYINALQSITDKLEAELQEV